MAAVAEQMPPRQKIAATHLPARHEGNKVLNLMRARPVSGLGFLVCVREMSFANAPLSNHCIRVHSTCRPFLTSGVLQGAAILSLQVPASVLRNLRESGYPQSPLLRLGDVRFAPSGTRDAIVSRCSSRATCARGDLEPGHLASRPAPGTIQGAESTWRLSESRCPLVRYRRGERVD